MGTSYGRNSERIESANPHHYRVIPLLRLPDATQKELKASGSRAVMSFQPPPDATQKELKDDFNDFYIVYLDYSDATQKELKEVVALELNFDRHSQDATQKELKENVASAFVGIGVIDATQKELKVEGSVATADGKPVARRNSERIERHSIQLRNTGHDTFDATQKELKASS